MKRESKRILLDGKPISESPSYAETLLVRLEVECYLIELTPDSDGARWLNGVRVSSGHEFAVLDVEGETLGTGPDAVGAIEDACDREVRRIYRAYDETRRELDGIRKAWRTLADRMG